MLGLASYLPPHPIPSEEIDLLLGTAPGWVASKSGVKTRYFAENESAAEMGAQAIRKVLAQTGISLEQIDCLICASGTAQQPIPCTAALILRELSMAATGIATFDLNSTCLSFVTAFDVAVSLVATGRFSTIVVVTAEIASKGINWSDRESAMLFGDGAVAMMLGATGNQPPTEVFAAAMETHPRGVFFTEIRAGGTKFPGYLFTSENQSDFLFSMDGRSIFRLAAEVLPDFVNRLLGQAGCRQEDLSCVIPHQASLPSMQLLQKRLGFSDQQFFINIQHYGNTIAASIPLALTEALETGRIQRGDLILLLGTSAGFSVGGMVLRI